MRTVRNRAAAAAGVLALASLLLAATIVQAASIPDRTQRVSSNRGAVANGSSSNPAVSSTGRIVVFDSEAHNLGAADPNGPIRDVYSLDRDRRRMRLVSLGPGGIPGNAPSDDPDIAAASRTVVFRSDATDLVAGDTNSFSDIFVRTGDGPVRRISVPQSGGEANGPSIQPSISSDGRFVTFASLAANLVAGDTNGAYDVFVKDLADGSVRRISGGPSGQGNGSANTPTIANDGRFVCFASDSTNLVADDTNGKPDVFVVDLDSGKTERVSVGAGGQQNDAVLPAFTQLSDVTSGGRYVVFDSDATNLVSGDRNQDTDVFIRDRARNRTSRVSLNASGDEGDNDSFGPTITPNGRYVAFQSFAENLTPDTAPGEDIFIRDRVLDATSVISVTSAGRARGAERQRQLLQRASISANGRHVVFTSAAANLSTGDTNGVEDVFIRMTQAPQLRLVRRPKSRHGRVTAEFRGDDPHATYALCRLDDEPQFLCPLRRAFAIPQERGGRHTLRVNAGGPGMLFNSTASRYRYTTTRSRPRVRITSPRAGARRVGTIRGVASSRGSSIRRVEVSVNRVTTRNCREYDGSSFSVRCHTLRFIRANGRRSWHLRLHARARGRVIIRVRAFDRAGNSSRIVKRELIVRR